MHIEFVTHWGGDVFFITDTDEVWRVWICQGYFPEMVCLTGTRVESDYSWPIAHLRGLLRAKHLPLASGLDKSHHFQGSNFNPRGWGQR